MPDVPIVKNNAKTMVIQSLKKSNDTCSVFVSILNKNKCFKCIFFT